MSCSLRSDSCEATPRPRGVQLRQLDPSLLSCILPSDSRGAIARSRDVHWLLHDPSLPPCILPSDSRGAVEVLLRSSVVGHHEVQTHPWIALEQPLQHAHPSRVRSLKHRHHRHHARTILGADSAHHVQVVGVAHRCDESFACEERAVARVQDRRRRARV